jgi:copper resistance protein B
MEMDDKSSTGKVMFDRLEWRDANGGGAFAWNGDAWYGNDYNKVWLKSEGERQRETRATSLGASAVRSDTTTIARTELLWDHTFTRWWNLQTGLRHDSGSGDSRDWAALGVQGLAPGFFNIEATAYVGGSGRTAARVSAERDLLFTQRLILQPEFEVNLYGKSDSANGIGSGLSDFELALRLRYEFRREFASYVGAVWMRRFGTSADFARAAGEDPNDIRWVAGLRVWF